VTPCGVAVGFQYCLHFRMEAPWSSNLQHSHHFHCTSGCTFSAHLFFWFLCLGFCISRFRFLNPSKYFRSNLLLPKSLPQFFEIILLGSKWYRPESSRENAVRSAYLLPFMEFLSFSCSNETATDPWARWIRFTTSHTISLRSFLILYCN